MIHVNWEAPTTRFHFASSHLQCSAECPVLPGDQEQSGNSSIMQAKCCISKCLCLTSCSTDKEDGHLPHKETTAHSLKGVLGNKAHGVLQLALLSCLQRLQSLDVLQQSPFLHGISEPDLSGYLIGVHGQSNTSSSGTVALRDGDTSDEPQDCFTHVVEGLAGNALRNIQGKGQLSGVEWALLLT